MNRLEELSILKNIDIDRKHIDNFRLETTEGTKRVKEKFYKNAVKERNSYINKQYSLYSKYKVILENEMVQRIKRLIPQDQSSFYDEELLKVSNFLELVKLNSNVSDSFKLKLDFIISSVNEETSLEELNSIIRKFIEKFDSFGINLSIEDFKYTMFTEKYMSSFFENDNFNSMKEVFEKIYFLCPQIKLQLKMNLYNIVEKYSDFLHKYLLNFIAEKNSYFGVTADNVIEKYVSYRNDLGLRIATDEFYNINVFLKEKKNINDYLENSPARNKNYNTFVPTTDYLALNEEAKISYNSAIRGLYLTLNELKKYYSYEFIIIDLLKKYKNKDSVKVHYESKKKEIEKEEKVRVSIYKEYLRANGIGFLAKKDEVKIKNSMLKMNEHIKKLSSLYDEFHDLEITNQLNSLTDSSSIYDLFLISLSSFSFLESKFSSTESFMDNSLEENIDEYLKFIYNPNNSLLRNINALVDFDISSIVSEKYRLLDLSITKDMIDKDSIDSTFDTLSFINLIQNIESSKISLETINNICKMYKIVSVDRGELEII